MPSPELVTVKAQPYNAEAPHAGLAEPITPTARFYVRSNFAVPRIDARTHRVAVGGAVERAFDLGLDELRALGTRTVATTMECAGNNRLSLVPLPTGEPWLGGAVSTASWTGVPLRAVLERAGLREGVREILVTGADRGKPKDHPSEISFARSLPLEKAMDADTLLAFEMNGEPLPPDHGAPLRLVVPSWYGMAGVKWVARVDALTEPFTGYYQKSRYIYDYDDGNEPPPVTTMRVKAIVVSPMPGAEVPAGPVTVRGQAWSGVGEVVKVEVAIDGGDSWQEATLLDPVSPYAWRAWELTWQASDPGRHVLRARATDSRGNTQPDVARWNRYGYGSNAVQPTIVYVK